MAKRGSFPRPQIPEGVRETAYLGGKVVELAPALPSLPDGKAAGLLPLLLEVPSQPLKKGSRTYFADRSTGWVVKVAKAFQKPALNEQKGDRHSMRRHGTPDSGKERIRQAWAKEMKTKLDSANAPFDLYSMQKKEIVYSILKVYLRIRRKQLLISRAVGRVGASPHVTSGLT